MGEPLLEGTNTTTDCLYYYLAMALFLLQPNVTKTTRTTNGHDDSHSKAITFFTKACTSTYTRRNKDSDGNSTEPDFKKAVHLCDLYKGPYRTNASEHENDSHFVTI